MEINLSEGMDIDAQTVITGRGCAIGQSGSGKSFLAGVIAEELCKAGMPFCIIDTEGEYASLRSVSRNLLIVGGDNGDIGTDVDFSKLFASSISGGIAVVLDISDVIDREDLVQQALGKLYEIENKERKPYLIIIEEADKFAPQVIRGKPNIIEEISVRGRKRGIGLFITTQRPANISKNVLAQCSYGFIGRLTIENDLNALRMLFNNNDKLSSITRLRTGEFLPFGLPRDSPFKAKQRVTTPIGSTPTIEPHGLPNSAIAKVIRELRSGIHSQAVANRSEKPRKKQSYEVVRAVSPSFTFEDATAYAEKMAKRRFVVFGKATERTDSVELKYVPLALCTVRFPSKRRNEYREYNCLLNPKGELVRLDNAVKTISIDEWRGSRSEYKRYLGGNPEGASEREVEKSVLV